MLNATHFQCTTSRCTSTTYLINHTHFQCHPSDVNLWLDDSTYQVNATLGCFPFANLTANCFNCSKAVQVQNYTGTRRIPVSDVCRVEDCAVGVNYQESEVVSNVGS